MNNQRGDKGVIVIGLPWLASGTSKFLTAQLRLLNFLHYKTLFIATPYASYHHRNHEIWTRFDEHKSELGAEQVCISTFRSKLRRGGVVGQLLAKRRDATALDWSINVSASAPLTGEIKAAISEWDVPSIITNYVYTLGFALKLQNYLAVRQGDSIHRIV
jgi:hypothetical protein